MAIGQPCIIQSRYSLPLLLFSSSSSTTHLFLASIILLHVSFNFFCPFSPHLLPLRGLLVGIVEHHRQRAPPGQRAVQPGGWRQRLHHLWHTDQVPGQGKNLHRNRPEPRRAPQDSMLEIVLKPFSTSTTTSYWLHGGLVHVAPAWFKGRSHRNVSGGDVCGCQPMLMDHRRGFNLKKKRNIAGKIFFCFHSVLSLNFMNKVKVNSKVPKTTYSIRLVCGGFWIDSWNFFEITVFTFNRKTLTLIVMSLFLKFTKYQLLFSKSQLFFSSFFTFFDRLQRVTFSTAVPFQSFTIEISLHVFSFFLNTTAEQFATISTAAC